MGKLFHIGDILSITTDRLVSPTLMDGVGNILRYMTDDDIYTHQIPRAFKECKPYLLAAYPQLQGVEVPELTKETLPAWLSEQVALFGERLEVEPLPPGAHAHRNPIAELQEMMPGKPILALDTDDPEQAAAQVRDFLSRHQEASS
jgi:hypothetical protein